MLRGPRLRRPLQALVVLAVAVVATACTSSRTTPSSTLAEPLPSLTTASYASPTLERIAERGRLRVGVKFDVPLFGYQDPVTKDLSGFDIEIARGIAAELFPDDPQSQRRIDFVEALSRNRENLLIADSVDLIVSTYTINDARKQLVDFAGPYYIAGQDILARKTDVDSGKIRGVSDVNGLRICSVTGSTSLANLRAAAPGADTSITKDKYSECFEALRRRQVDAMTTDDVILLGLAQNFPEFAIAGNPFRTEPYGIGVRKGDAAMRDRINEILQNMFENGQWAEAFRKTVGTTGALVPIHPELEID